MWGEDQPLQNGDRIGNLLGALGAGETVARGRAEDLLRQVTEVCGAGLQRIMEILNAREKLDDATLEALAADELVAGLLAMYGLQPRSLEARVAAAPEVRALDVVGRENQAGLPALIPVDSQLVRVNNPAGGTPAGSWHDMSGGTWEPVPEIAGLESGEVAGFLIRGYPVLACRTGQNIYAYRDYCPRCTGSMAGARMERALTAPFGGGLLCCPTCRGHFDVRQAGACLEDRDLHLDPLPLLVRGGMMSVAIPTDAMPAVPAREAPVPEGPAEPTPVQSIPLVPVPEPAVSVPPAHGLPAAPGLVPELQATAGQDS